jgi:hypothetical protein
MLNVRARACKCLHASRPFEGDPSPAWIRSVRVQQIPPMGGGEFSFDSLGGGDRASLTIWICFFFTKLLPHSASREHVFLSLHPSDNYGTTSGSAGAEVAGGVSDNWLDTLHQRMWTSFTSAD